MLQDFTKFTKIDESLMSGGLIYQDKVSRLLDNHFKSGIKIDDEKKTHRTSGSRLGIVYG